jgi:hypothetical protein
MHYKLRLWAALYKAAIIHHREEADKIQSEPQMHSGVTIQCRRLDYGSQSTAYAAYTLKKGKLTLEFRIDNSGSHFTYKDPSLYDNDMGIETDPDTIVKVMEENFPAFIAFIQRSVGY